MSQKILVLDTNIVLDDSSVWEQFKDAFVVVPGPVLSELDNFKQRRDDVGYHARKFSNILDKLGSRDQLTTHGAPTPGGGRLYLSSATNYYGKDPLTFHVDIGESDNDILRVAKVQQLGSNLDVELVTQDANLRVVARANGIVAKPRRGGEVDVRGLHTGLQMVVSEGMVSRIHERKKKARYVSPDIVFDKGNLDFDMGRPFNNQYFIFQTADDELVSIDEMYNRVFRYDQKQGLLVPVEIIPPRNMFAGILPRNPEQLALMDVMQLNSTSMVAGYGPAGTGKTLCMLAVSLELANRRRVKAQQENHEEDSEACIYITKPMNNVAGEEYGFLPGDLEDKIRVNYVGAAKNIKQIMRVWPLLESIDGKQVNIKQGRKMSEVLGKDLQSLQDAGIVQLHPLGIIRGDSILPEEILFVDEAQNTSPKVMRTIGTRGLDGSKTFCCGDITQVDNPYVREEYNGLADLVDEVTSNRQEKYGFTGAVKLVKSERGLQAEWADRYLGRSKR